MSTKFPVSALVRSCTITVSTFLKHRNMRPWEKIGQELWNHSQDEGGDVSRSPPRACRGHDTVSYNKRTPLIVPFPVLQKQSR